MRLLLSFPDQSQSYAHGVEFGRLLEKIERGDEVIKNNGFPVRIENVQVLKDACTQYGYIATFRESSVEGWVEFLGIKKTTTNN